jgi:hypothetical protein
MANWPKKKKNIKLSRKHRASHFFLLGTKINLTYICVYNVLTTPRAFVN